MSLNFISSNQGKIFVSIIITTTILLYKVVSIWYNSMELSGETWAIRLLWWQRLNDDEYVDDSGHSQPDGWHDEGDCPYKLLALVFWKATVNHGLKRRPLGPPNPPVKLAYFWQILFSCSYILRWFIATRRSCSLFSIRWSFMEP